MRETFPHSVDKNGVDVEYLLKNYRVKVIQGN